MKSTIKKFWSKSQFAWSQVGANLSDALKSDLEESTDAPDLAALEERVMLSATPLAVDATAAQDNVQQLGGEATQESNSANTNNLQATDRGSSTEGNSNASTNDSVKARLMKRHVVFVNSSINDADKLTQLVEQLGATRSIEVIELDANQEGVGQVSSHLSNYKNLKAVHFVTEGEAGKLKLGST